MAKEQYISFIKDEIRKGNVKYNDVHLVFLSKFKVSEPTFVKYWKIANEEYSEERRAIEKEKARISKQMQKEAVKRDILSKLESQEILTEIARGEGAREGEEIKPNDRIKAVTELAKMNGWNDVIKNEHTHLFGKDAIDESYED